LLALLKHHYTSHKNLDQLHSDKKKVGYNPPLVCLLPLKRLQKMVAISIISNCMSGGGVVRTPSVPSAILGHSAKQWEKRKSSVWKYRSSLANNREKARK
jgi:hypothetical protein